MSYNALRATSQAISSSLHHAIFRRYYREYKKIMTLHEIYTYSESRGLPVKHRYLLRGFKNNQCHQIIQFFDGVVAAYNVATKNKGIDLDRVTALRDEVKAKLQTYL